MDADDFFYRQLWDRVTTEIGIQNIPGIWRRYHLDVCTLSRYKNVDDDFEKVQVALLTPPQADLWEAAVKLTKAYAGLVR